MIAFYLHRNIVGTFLTQAEWSLTSEQNYKVTTIVRIGNGNSSATLQNNNQSSIDISPTSLRQKYASIMEAATNKTFMNLTETSVLNNMIENLPAFMGDESTKKCIKLGDKFFRKKYWQYLRNSTLVYFEPMRKKEADYFVYTYGNGVGFFMAIGSCKGDKV